MGYRFLPVYLACLPPRKTIKVLSQYLSPASSDDNLLLTAKYFILLMTG